MKRNIYIGTSGWSYKHWKGLFYPPGLKTTEWIRFYSDHFKATEINGSFYKLPRTGNRYRVVRKSSKGFFILPQNEPLSHPHEKIERTGRTT